MNSTPDCDLEDLKVYASDGHLRRSNHAPSCVLPLYKMSSIGIGISISTSTLPIPTFENLLSAVGQCVLKTCCTSWPNHACEK